MKDWANRDWATKPSSQAWRDAAAKEFKFYHPEPRVKISSAVPVTEIRFERKMK